MCAGRKICLLRFVARLGRSSLRFEGFGLLSGRSSLMRLLRFVVNLYLLTYTL